jgi:hypothetical protein
LGVDYYINKKSTAGIVLSGFINPSFSHVTNKSKVLARAGNPVSLVTAGKLEMEKRQHQPELYV